MEKSPESPPLMKLTVAPELGQLGIKAKAAVIEGVDVKRKLSGALKKELKAKRTRLDIDQTLNSPALQGYRELYDQYGVREQPAAESLLQLLQKNGKLPNISNVVDIYNMVAAETGLAIGAHDLDKVNGDVEIKVTDGNERFTPLFGETWDTVPEGKYAAVDESGEILCWMELKQSDMTKVEADKTKNVFLYVQGNKEVSEETIELALRVICKLIDKYCGGNYTVLNS